MDGISRVFVSFPRMFGANLVTGSVDSSRFRFCAVAVFPGRGVLNENISDQNLIFGCLSLTLLVSSSAFALLPTGRAVSSPYSPRPPQLPLHNQ